MLGLFFSSISWIKANLDFISPIFVSNEWVMVHPPIIVVLSVALFFSVLFIEGMVVVLFSIELLIFSSNSRIFLSNSCILFSIFSFTGLNLMYSAPIIASIVPRANSPVAISLSITDVTGFTKFISCAVNPMVAQITPIVIRARTVSYTHLTLPTTILV